MKKIIFFSVQLQNFPILTIYDQVKIMGYLTVFYLEKQLIIDNREWYDCFPFEKLNGGIIKCKYNK